MCEEQAQKDKTDVIDNVSGVQNAFCHVVEVLSEGDVIQYFF